MGLIVNITCSTCNGDGYMTVDKTSWERFLVWSADPTEDKINSPDTFPEFLKRIHNIWGGAISKIVSLPCPDCGGQKTITKEVSFEELKNLIK